MTLPFTAEQFFDVFAEYNRTRFWTVLGLWVASLVAFEIARRVRSRGSRLLTWYLAALWLWSAVAYHALLFTRINPAAWMFAALFLLQAALFFWLGVVQGHLSFAPLRNAWASVAWVLIVYSLVYPGINAVQYSSLSRIPAFGVPCPTTIFTAGVLMLATPRSWRLSIVPVMWSVIGGSAANLLGVRADYALPIAGLAVAIFSMQRSTPGRMVHGNRMAPFSARIPRSE